MGKKTNTTNQTSSDTQNYTETVTGIKPYQDLFNKGYTGIGNLWTNRISQPLNLQYFNGFSNNLDPIVQNTMSQGIQNLKAAQSGANSELANRLSVAGTGDNSSLLAALQRMSNISTAGNQNALIPQALEQQRNFDLQRQSILQADNQMRLAARAQAIQELLPGLNLLGLLQQMAGISAGKKVNSSQYTNQTNTTTSKSGPWWKFGFGD